MKYSDLDDSSIEFEKIRNHDFVETRKLVNYFNVGYEKYYNYSSVQAYVYSIVNIAISFLIVLAFLIIAAGIVNRVIPFRIKATISVYSASWAFLLYAVGNMVGITQLFYVGVVLSFIFNIIAVKQIVKVEK